MIVHFFKFRYCEDHNKYAKHGRITLLVIGSLIFFVRNLSKDLYHNSVFGICELRIRNPICMCSAQVVPPHPDPQEVLHCQLSTPGEDPRAAEEHAEAPRYSSGENKLIVNSPTKISFFPLPRHEDLLLSPPRRVQRRPGAILRADDGDQPGEPGHGVRSKASVHLQDREHISPPLELLVSLQKSF